MKNTPIEWCDDSVNPVMGCAGCELWTKTNRSCYAGILTERNQRMRKGRVRAARKKGKTHHWKNGEDGWPANFDTPRTFPGRMEEATRWEDLRARKRAKKVHKPWLDGLPRCIFVSDMGDALSPSISFDYLKREIIDVVATPVGKRHIWMWLTKQPKRMSEFSDWLKERGISWPPQLWAMTSVTRQITANVRIPWLLKVGDSDTTRALSCEPLWGPVSLKPWIAGLDWVIVGGESGDKPVVMDLAWARLIRDECVAAKVPFFLKQLGGSSQKKGGDWSKFPKDLRVRQMPRRSRKEQIKGAGKTHREKWERIPVSRTLAARLTELAGRKGKTRREFLDAFLQKNLPK